MQAVRQDADRAGPQAEGDLRRRDDQIENEDAQQDAGNRCRTGGCRDLMRLGTARF